MQVASFERARVRYECIKAIARLKLAPEKQEVLVWFIEQYLAPENKAEETEYENYIRTMPKKNREEAMEIISSYRKEGRAEGRAEGRVEEALSFVQRLLSRKFGNLESPSYSRLAKLSLAQLELLGEDLIDFRTPADLDAWLSTHTG